MMVFSPSALAASSRCRPSTNPQDWRLQALVECWPQSRLFASVEGGTTLGRNVDVSDWDGLALHHGRTKE